jgi:Ca-activated chloride channel homolog
MKRTWCFFLLLAVTVLPAPAAGLILVHEPGFWWPGPPPHPLPPPRPLPPPAWAPLEVAFTKATARIRDQIATTTFEQEFYNPNARQLEGTFLFPVPKGAHLDKFTMEINGQPVEAELLTAEKARGIYEDIVRRLRDPALLEYSGRDLFKVRIFPIEPHSRKRITLSYTQLLQADHGLVTFQLPLNTEKFSAKPLQSLAVKIDLETKRPLKSIYSPTHQVEIKRHGEGQATIGYETQNARPDLDFELLFSQEAGPVGVSLLTHKTGSAEGFFLLLASPGELKSGRVAPKDVIFVLDTSGSMAGAKLEQAKKALLFCVENLNDSDRFELLRFSTEVEPLFDKLVQAGKEHRDQALKFIKELRPTGGTAIDDALRKALSVRPEKTDRPCVVIFLTDGRPTVGITGEKDIVEHAVSAASGARIFCFGIGTDVNTHLLDKITEGTRATSQYVLADEDLEVKVSNFFAKIKEPVLANPKLKFPEGVRVTKVYPASLPDLFKGEQLVVAGRYSGQGEGEILLEGMTDGERRVFEYKVQFPPTSSDHSFIPRLWATRRVGYLLDEIRLRGENKELKDEVVELARQYGIVTPYTAYLILEDEQHRGLAQGVRSFPELERSDRARQATRELYNSYSSSYQVSGDLAVSGARAYSSLKEASVSQEALSLSGTEAFRMAPAAAPAIIAGRAYQAGLAGPGSAGPQTQTAAKNLASEFARQARFVQGRTFYQNGAQWIDSEVQKRPQAKRVRLQFGSEDYFAFLKKQPETSAWLALGTSLQLLVGDTIYEVFE